jgi:exo-1,4-beta-D-glucosaminidase
MPSASLLVTSPSSRAARAALALTAAIVSVHSLGAQEPRAVRPLDEGWFLQSSEKVTARGPALSKPGFPVKGWHATRVPATVVAALVEDGTFRDPYFGMNLRSIPGANYPLARNFTNEPFPEGSPFRVPWWYRTDFDVPASFEGRAVWLRFEGLNYRANVWVNGKQVGRKEDVVGAFRQFTFDVTASVLPGKRNALAVEVFPPQVNDLGITWVDWNPAPPDKEMGLWRGVSLVSTGPVVLEAPHVIPDLEVPSLARATLTVTADLRNATSGALTATVKGRIEGREFARDVTLAAGEKKRVSFDAAGFPALALDDPRVWWPYGWGRQELYEMDLVVEAGGAPSDSRRVTFGVQRSESELTAQGYRQFRFNGRPILITGGGWASDMLLRPSSERTKAELEYVKGMNLNTVRLEGKLETDEFYDMADRMGILVMPGWCCCDHWEQWGKWHDENHVVAVESQRDQITRIRNHPSVFVWLNSSDGKPSPEVERAYLKVLEERDWKKPVLSSAAADVSTVSGPSGVKMLGPYDYVPPNYWLLDTQKGGAYGFNTETSPGPAIPPVESLRAMLGADHLWPIDDVWNFHAGGQEFKNVERYTAALEARYGKARDVLDYVWKSQAMAYEGERAMFEAFRRNRGKATGIVQWMLNNAWPSIIWHLYDWYLRPGGGYFGAKVANEPVHVLYSYDDRSVVVANDALSPRRALKVSGRVLDLGAQEKLALETTIDVPADSVVRAFTLPEVPGLTTTYFVRLRVEDASGAVLSRNFYWLSTKPDVLDWERAEWFFTPQKQYADLTGLGTLPRVSLEVSSEFAPGKARVRISNPGSSLAFLVRLKVTKGKAGDEVLPVLWEDNYFELLPGEAREISASYSSSDLGGAIPAVEVDGWNVEPLVR